MVKRPRLSILIPCFNEARNLERGALREVRAGVKRLGWPCEVIVVDDGSTDGSRALLRKAIASWKEARLIESAHWGKPAALRAALQRARGEWVLFTDLDQSVAIGEWKKLAPWTARGFNAVIGSRGSRRDGASHGRRILSAVFRFLRRRILLREIEDTQCGFKCFRRSALRSVFPRLAFFTKPGPPKGWKVTAFDVELLFRLQKAGHALKEVEVVWRDRDLSVTKHARGGGMDFLRESLEMAAEVLRVWAKDRMGRFSRHDKRSN